MPEYFLHAEEYWWAVFIDCQCIYLFQIFFARGPLRIYRLQSSSLVSPLKATQEQCRSSVWGCTALHCTAVHWSVCCAHSACEQTVNSPVQCSECFLCSAMHWPSAGGWVVGCTEIKWFTLEGRTILHHTTLLVNLTTLFSSSSSTPFFSTFAYI